MIPIVLNNADGIWATKVGKQRWADSAGRKAKFKGATEDHHIRGAYAELAFCRALGLPWPASNLTFTSEPDVWPNWEIRYLSPGLRGVKVVESDPDERLVVWVGGTPPRWEIMGYVVAGGAKQRKDWYQDPGSKGRSIWLVPERNMIPIEPGFHEHHAYVQSPTGGWSCAYCTEVIS